MQFDYESAFSRNIGMLSPDEMRRISKMRIGIAGQGGVGGNYLLSLTRLGFQHFTIVDGDVFEPSNTNRQAGAMVATMGRHKVEVMAELARAINPNVDIRARPDHLGPATLDFFFDGLDLAVNAIDYLSAGVYESLHDGASARGLYSITVSPFGYGASMTTFGPTTPKFAECFGMAPGDDEIAQLRKFWRAVTPARFPHAYIPLDWLSPQPPKENLRFSSLNPCIYLATAMACAEVVITLLGKRPPVLAPNVLQIDLLTRAMAVSAVDTPAALRPVTGTSN